MASCVIQNSQFDQLAGQFQGGIGGKMLHLSETASTMDVARSLIEASNDIHLIHGKTIIAEKQHRGRGRFGREWFSGPGLDILISVVLCPRMAFAGQITIMASLAVAQTVDEIADVSSSIKWPNDVLVGGYKICGVIAEGVAVGDVAAVVLGIGLNVNSLPNSDEAKNYAATSMRELMPSSSELDRAEVLEKLLIRLNELYSALERGETIVPEWRERLNTLGSEIELKMIGQDELKASKVICGIAEDVDDFGRLLIRESDGTVRAVASGEVTLRNST